MNDLKSIIGKVATGAPLSREEAASAFDSMMSGEATPSQMGGLLMALRVRGETVEEITGAAQMLRSRMNRVEVPRDAIDIVGTGGDSHGTYNVRTATGTFYHVVGTTGLRARGGRNVLTSSNPFAFTGKVVEKVSLDRYIVHNGTVTSCCRAWAQVAVCETVSQLAVFCFFARCSACSAKRA